MGIGALRRYRDTAAEDTAAGSPRRGPDGLVVTDGEHVPTPDAPDAGGTPREPEAAKSSASQVVVPGEQPEGADPEVADEHVTEVTPVEDAQSDTAGTDDSQGETVEGDQEPPAEPEPAKATSRRRTSSK